MKKSQPAPAGGEGVTSRFPLVLVMFLLVAAAVSLTPHNSRQPLAAAAMSSHSPIVIIGNANFTSSNGVTGGSGTPGDPYVISGWGITDAWPGDGILVVNTSAYLVVKDVAITASSRDVEPEFPRGVGLLNVSHVVVSNVTVSGNAFGFEVGGSSNVSMLGNVALGNWVGLAITDAVDVLIQGNVLRGGDVRNPTTGMSLGIWMGSCGVPVCPATRVTVVGNTVVNNIHGISVATSSNVAVYRNNFVNNTNAASADASSYRWDDGYPLGGNYWSNYTGTDQCSGPLQNNCTGPDGIGDTPYVIGAQNEDRYPLMQAAGADTTPPSVSIASPVDGAFFTSSPIQVSGAALDQGGSGIRDVQVRVNNGTWTPASGVASWQASVSLTVGANRIEARARDWAGNTAVASIDVTFAIPPLSVTPILPKSFVGSANGTTVVLSANVTGGIPPYTFLWTFGDGGSSTAASPVHRYAGSGSYNASVTVTDSQGTTATKTFVVLVPACPGCHPPGSDWSLPIVALPILAFVAVAIYLAVRLTRAPRRP